MLSDETARVPADKLESNEKDYGGEPEMLTAIYKLHATDFDKQINDDQLYPGKASDAILKKWPPTVVFTSEFDFYKRDNVLFAQRLKSVGRLAEISNMPGSTHGYWGTNMESQETKWFYEEATMAFKTLVDC